MPPTSPNTHKKQRIYYVIVNCKRSLREFSCALNELRGKATRELQRKALRYCIIP